MRYFEENRVELDYSEEEGEAASKVVRRIKMRETSGSGLKKLELYEEPREEASATKSRE